MKTTISNAQILSQLDQNEIDQLTAQVTETVAPDAIQPVQKVNFSAADLWKIHRTVRTATTRRRFA